MNEKEIMSKLTALLLGGLLSVSLVSAGEPKAGDQKWLQAVEKMVNKGDTKISTSDEGRVSLLKEWAGKNGYSIKVTKTDTGFNLEASKTETSMKTVQK
jgi:hypothetical protein